MNSSLVITTINSLNQNIRLFSKGCKKNKWNLIIIGDKKSPKTFKLNYGNYFSYEQQLNLKLSFAKICPANNYARKNIGYLISMKTNKDFIIETDDDNVPKKNFFKEIKLGHYTDEIKNNTWVNIYDLFLKNKKYKIWPRGIPLDEIFKNKIKIKKNKNLKNFYLQQGVAENNPDVDAIFRLIYKKIDVKFKNYKVSLGNAKSTLNSQNTIWHKSIFELMYLPSTCTMRCTDIWRSIIAFNILKKNDLGILIYGTTMYQKRNYHNLMNDFNLELPMYLNSKKLNEILENIKIKKGLSFFSYNLLYIYKILIKKNFFHKRELLYLKAWLKDCNNIKKNQI